MWTKYILFLGIFCLGNSYTIAQNEAVTCDLLHLYQLTLANSPTVQRQEIRNQIVKTGKQTARSQFDYQLVSDVSLSRSSYNFYEADPLRALIGNTMNTNNFSLSTGVQRTFRTGTTANVGLQYQRVSDSNPINGFSETIGAFIPDNTTTTSLSITQPLLRGRGRDIVTANEEVAELNLAQQQQNAHFVISGQVLTTVNAYWQYFSATESLKIYQDNEERVMAVLDMTKELVNADKKPAGDLTQIQADVLDKERQTILAAQNVYSAQQNLGRSIGLETSESQEIGLPLSNFPRLDEGQEVPSLESLLTLARAHRADLKALEKSLEVQQLQVRVAENNIKQQLNLRAFSSYGGAAMGNGVDRFLTALGNYEGRNYQIGVGMEYIFPINNNQAEAALLNAQLTYADQETYQKDQIRNIELNVSIAYNNYLNSIDALKKSSESLAYYEEVFTNEQYKFQNGLTTLLNLILLQERLTFAQLDYIKSQQQYAMAISNLRYETGTLYPSDAPVGFDEEVFYTLPGTKY
ncbi:TolC family protein [Lewinella sp. LCG006]|uniref:TolC family protein n=1 Tax=Lewinella sp. LCG006 TaxID=3231911 RepID=UPI00345F6A63